MIINFTYLLVIQFVTVCLRYTSLHNFRICPTSSLSLAGRLTCLRTSELFANLNYRYSYTYLQWNWLVSTSLQKIHFQLSSFFSPPGCCCSPIFAQTVAYSMSSTTSSSSASSIHHWSGGQLSVVWLPTPCSVALPSPFFHCWSSIIVDADIQCLGVAADVTLLLVVYLVMSATSTRALIRFTSAAVTPAWLARWASSDAQYSSLLSLSLFRRSNRALRPTLLLSQAAAPCVWRRSRGLAQRQTSWCGGSGGWEATVIGRASGQAVPDTQEHAQRNV